MMAVRVVVTVIDDINQPAISVGSVTSLEPSQTVLNCSGTGNSFCKTQTGRLLKTHINIFEENNLINADSELTQSVYPADTYIVVILYWNHDVHL